VVALVTAPVVACGSSTDKDVAYGSLRIAAGKEPVRPAGFYQHHVRLMRPQTVLTFNLCVDGPPVAVKSVKLAGAHGLRLADWGWRPFFSGIFGSQPGLATKNGYDHTPIKLPCKPRGTYAAFAVSVERTGRGAGTERGFTIEFDGGSLNVPYGIALCPGECSQADIAASGGPGA
jgi:hypothetical protein